MELADFFEFFFFFKYICFQREKIKRKREGTWKDSVIQLGWYKGVLREISLLMLNITCKLG